ncbi:outer membrane lipoprotein-sorting protein, partial [Candidatus Desantisbacteria bacterium]|nr:outer membrane lipoprotein-sorting protein [Candidatus Desantisbacteria bacterium]
IFSRFILFVFLCITCAGAVTLTPREIMWNVINKYRVDDEVEEIKMTLINKDDRTWIRIATFYTKKIDKDNNKIFFRFHSPADLAGSGVLTIENKNGEDDQWMYVPAYHTARRIPAASRSDQYMGTDFYYEDVITPRVEEYEYKITGEEKINGTNCSILEGIPVSERLKKESGYGRVVSFVDTEKFMILKQDLYSKKDGTLIKQLTNYELRNYNGFLRWGKREMLTLKTGHRTIVEYTKQEINKGVSDEYFTMRYLKRGK